MDWLSGLRKAVDYMEQHLLDQISAQDIAEEVSISSFYLQRGFAVMTGLSIQEYLRCRRLYLAALELSRTDCRIIDLAAKYGYDSPESFTRAFSRFHGASPSEVRKDVSRIRPFLPLQISIEIKGGNEMDVRIEHEACMKMIGVSCGIDMDHGYQECPAFWDEFKKKYCTETPLPAVRDCRIGEFALCIQDPAESTRFRYMIAGIDRIDEVPEGMEILEVPAHDWAKFRCTGPMPGALQTVNTAIFREWLPGNPDYEMDGDLNIEHYLEGDLSAADYVSEIWIPVRKR
jgi:AraC family transcriptional regulator